MNERIKKLRKALGFTQHEFADRLGISRGNIGSYEVGKSNPGGSVITLICKTFNVSEEWLRTGEGEMFLPKADTVLEQLAAEHGLTGGDRTLIEKFLNLKPEDRRVLVDYVRETAAAIAGQEAAAPAFAPVRAPTIEEEARAEANQQAQLIYQQILAEKKAAAGMLSESSGPLAGGGTAKQA